MNPLINYLCRHVRSFVLCEEGQDLVEYSLVFVMIAFGAVTGMGFVATGVNNEFSTVAQIINNNIH